MLTSMLYEVPVTLLSHLSRVSSLTCPNPPYPPSRSRSLLSCSLSTSGIAQDNGTFAKEVSSYVGCSLPCSRFRDQGGRAVGCSVPLVFDLRGKGAHIEQQSHDERRGGPDHQAVDVQAVRTARRAY